MYLDKSVEFLILPPPLLRMSITKFFTLLVFMVLKLWRINFLSPEPEKLLRFIKAVLVALSTSSVHFLGATGFGVFGLLVTTVDFETVSFLGFGGT